MLMLQQFCELGSFEFCSESEDKLIHDLYLFSHYKGYIYFNFCTQAESKVNL